VLVNLLSNALKFTLKGFIKIKVSILNEEYLNFNKLAGQEHIDIEDINLGSSRELREREDIEMGRSGNV
jgi:signal transduction histidine kinase